MQLTVIQRIIGLLLMVYSIAMLPPVLVGWWMDGKAISPFIVSFAVILSAGLTMWLPVMHQKKELRLRDGFVVVAMFWLVLSLFSALPFVLSAVPSMSFTDAVFESVSGFTTTGATVITGLDRLPKSILFYRQELQWLGGMGVIVLAVAILPMLGVGGMQLYRAEMPGPLKDTKLTPRITETAKALWYVYLGLTVTCAVAYWLAGMTLFDAVAHSFSTVSTAGFSTHDNSIGYFNSPLIEMIAVVFMLLGGINFGLHFMAWRAVSLKRYWLDYECKSYLRIFLLVTAVTLGYLYLTETFEDVGSIAHHGIFQVASMLTTTGFTTAQFYVWPGFLPILLIFVSFIGGSGGSTTGGIKVLRVMLLLKQSRRELLRLLHPSARIAIKVGDKALNDRVIDAVWGFFAAYVGVFIVMQLLLMSTGLDQVTAFSAVAATLNNLGPGLGQVSANFASINDFSKWVLCAAMLLGRLEIFTLLVLLTPAFWRR